MQADTIKAVDEHDDIVLQAGGGKFMVKLIAANCPACGIEVGHLNWLLRLLGQAPLTSGNRLILRVALTKEIAVFDGEIGDEPLLGPATPAH